MTSHDLACLAEVLTAHARLSPRNWPDIADCDIPEYVKKAMDGAIVDDLEPIDFLAEGKERNDQSAVALRTIENALMAQYRRPLNTSDLVKIGVAIVAEWDERAEKAREEAFDREQGKLWENADTPFVENF
jgi:hypothetical protein